MDLNDVILKIVDMIMRFAPIGVFALMAALVVDYSGDADIFTALGMYMLTVTIGLFLLILGFYPLIIRIFAGIRIPDFLKRYPAGSTGGIHHQFQCSHLAGYTEAGNQ